MGTPGEGRDGCFEHPSGQGPVCGLLDPLQQFSAGSAPENAEKKYEVAPESAKKFVGASFFPPPLDIKGDVFAEMEARIARVERTWDRQSDKVPPCVKWGEERW